MSTETILEQRLEAVEQAIADLQRRLDSTPAPSNWLDKLIGSITDQSAFEEILAYGRDFRSSDRPRDDPTEP